MPGRVVTAVLKPAAWPARIRAAGGEPVAIGIGEMQRRAAAARSSIRARLVAISWLAISSVCLARLQWVMVCAPMVTSGSSANGFNSSQDMQSSRQIAASIDAMMRAERADLAGQIVAARQGAQPVVQPRRTRPAWPPASRYRGGSATPPIVASIEEALAITISSAIHHRAGAFGEIAGDIDRERCVKFPHHRQREIPVVAIAVVEGEAGKTPREVALGQPPMHFVHGDDVDAARAQMGKHRAQEFRRDFEMAVGLELGVARRADMMQHENGADAGEDRPQQMMRAGEIKRFQSGADDVVAKLLHQGMAGRLDSGISKLAEGP